MLLSDGLFSPCTACRKCECPYIHVAFGYICAEPAAGLVHPTWFEQVFLGMCFMWLKSLHRGSGGRLKSLHTAVVPACSCCRMGAPSSCGGALPAHNCDSLSGVLGSPGRGTHLHFSIYPGEQHGEWRPAVRPVAGAPLCHDPVNGKSNTVPSTEELKALDVQTNC